MEYDDSNVVLSSSSPLKESSAEEHFSINGVSFVVNDIPISLKYIQTENKELKLVWDMQVEMVDNWYHAHVDASSGDVLSLVDWVSDASYEVNPFGTNDPENNTRKLVVDPENAIASPYGWHFDGKKNYTTTIGNNVIAQDNTNGKSDYKKNHRPSSTKKDGLVFDFAADLKDEPVTYVDAAITNLFYWNNIIHDLFYIYGFDEVSGEYF